MSHEQKGEIILFGIFLLFVLALLVAVICWIHNVQRKQDTWESKKLTFTSIFGIILLLVVHWYHS